MRPSTSKFLGALAGALTVAVAGREVTLRDVSDLSITLTIPESGALTGKWSGHGDSGSFTAVRRSQSARV